jgi:hypothetical protein
MGQVAEDAAKVGSGRSGCRGPARRPAWGATGGSDGAGGSSHMRDGRPRGQVVKPSAPLSRAVRPTKLPCGPRMVSLTMTSAAVWARRPAAQSALIRLTKKTTDNQRFCCVRVRRPDEFFRFPSSSLSRRKRAEEGPLRPRAKPAAFAQCYPKARKQQNCVRADCECGSSTSNNCN